MQVTEAVAWFQAYADRLQQEKEHLTELDSRIGDGDHGANMARGWKAVKEELESFDQGLSECFMQVSKTLIAKVGGASGPLYGTAFLRMSMKLKGEASVSPGDWAELIQAGAEGIRQRGKVSGGEKTMYDVWAPLVDAARDGADLEETVLLRSLAETAREKAEATREMKATKGRASYLGERSIGHLDPGAVSTALLFEVLCDTLSREGM
ncbi:dihydroxyacetone kinase subunit DhaL [Paludifilum halophilum]|uniref:dihydroxyacetone kinase subunit DhaL n=1 Tax=Paludifilum halophilum TaxID=1642702 RepID=UPI001F0AD259|nr:dihydroxyacetone kinase subunit DhaL [Paludifilum halophilum]